MVGGGVWGVRRGATETVVRFLRRFPGKFFEDWKDGVVGAVMTWGTVTRWLTGRRYDDGALPRHTNCSPVSASITPSKMGGLSGAATA